MEGTGVETGLPMVVQEVPLGTIQMEDIQEARLLPSGLVEVVQAAGVADGTVVENAGVTQEQVDPEQQLRVINNIKEKIRELCEELANEGEESFLVSVRLQDGASSHLGSIKGDNFILLRQEIMHEFSDFCTGASDEEEKPDVNELSQFEEPQDMSTVEAEGGEVEEEFEEEESVDVRMEIENDGADGAEIPELAPINVGETSFASTNDTGVNRPADHQYSTHNTRRRVRLAQVNNEEKENEENGSMVKGEATKTDILFLCEICKKVFSSLKELKTHKLELHNEGDHNCPKCPRIFTLKAILDRHLEDAHGPGIQKGKYICDTCVMEFDAEELLHAHIEEVHNIDLPMKCDVCERTFEDLETLMDHRGLHFDYSGFCRICWQGFFDPMELETHLQSNCRYKEAMFKCDICGKKYSKLHTMNKHIDTHPIHSPFSCRMCGRGFELERELKAHRTAAHIIRPFKCEYCEKTFKKKESLIDHRRVHIKSHILNFLTDPPETAFKCDACGTAMMTEEALKDHVRQHEEARIEYQCEVCQKRFFKRNLLILHCRKEHKLFLTPKPDGDSEGLTCDWEGCGKVFTDRTKWKYHVKYHRDRLERAAKGIKSKQQQDPVTCPICNKVLRYKSYLKLHLQSHTGDKPFQCDTCGMSYGTQRRLNDHIRTHSGERPFKCPICPKYFTSTSLRNQHMVVHWGSKTFICDVCGKGFMSRKHFHDHMRIHAGEELYKCETCGKDFIYWRSLVRHNLTHIDPKERPKPYKCQYCGKEYTEVTGYKHHMRAVHTGETPFQCDICGESFHRNDKLKRHLKSRHNKKENSLPGPRTIVTTRRTGRGAPITIIKTEPDTSQEEGTQTIVPIEGIENVENELHVDVIQDNNAPRVVLIGVTPGEEGETTYVQETQVIEGPDGTRYIIAGSGEELQIIESQDIQQIEEGSYIEGTSEVQEIVQHVEQANVPLQHDQMTFTADQETLATLATMASVADVADVVQQ